MTDFKKLAEQAKAQSDAQIAATQQQQASEAAARRAEFERQAAELNDKVRPFFEDAARSFDQSGVPVEIKENWAGGVQPMRPELSFQCKGPQIRNAHGGYAIPEGIAVRAQYWDEGIVITIDKDPYNRGVNRIGGDLQDAIPEAIRLSLENYYKSLHKIKTRP